MVRAERADNAVTDAGVFVDNAGIYADVLFPAF
jgi:hypothetical protein